MRQKMKNLNPELGFLTVINYDISKQILKFLLKTKSSNKKIGHQHLYRLLDFFIHFPNSTFFSWIKSIELDLLDDFVVVVVSHDFLLNLLSH